MVALPVAGRAPTTPDQATTDPATPDATADPTARGRATPRHATRRPRWADAPLPGAAAAVALLAVAAAVLEGVADALPDAPLAGMLTPLRGAVLAGLVAVGLPTRGLHPRWRPGPISHATLALLVTAGLSCVVAGTGWASWRALLTGMALAALTARLLTLDAGAHRGLGLLAWLGVGLAGVTAVTQSAAGTATGFCRGSWTGSYDVCAPGTFVRVIGTYPNPNLLAAALLLLIPLAAGWVASTQREPGARLVGWSVVGIGALALALTGSRAGLLGAVVAAATYAVLRRPTPARVHGAVAAGSVALLASAGWSLAGGDPGVRGTIWRAGLALVRDHPLGVGLGHGGDALQATAGVGPAYQHAHNLWLSWFVEAGLPGGLAVLAITAALAVGVLRAARDGSTSATPYGCALAGFAAMSLLDHPANAERLALLLWVVIGAAVVSWAGRPGGGGWPGTEQLP